MTGKSFVDVVRDKILDPLGMRTTDFTYTHDMQARAVTGYHPRLDPLRLLLPKWVIGSASGRWLSLRRFLVDGPAWGGLVGSLQDATRFLQMHLRDGELDGVQVLTSEATRSMRQIIVQGRRYDHGLGWLRPAKERDSNSPFVEHRGGGAGFFNVMRINLTREIGVVVMGNATRYDADAVARPFTQ